MSMFAESRDYTVVDIASAMFGSDLLTAEASLNALGQAGFAFASASAVYMVLQRTTDAPIPTVFKIVDAGNAMFQNDTAALEALLNPLGAEGWQVVDASGPYVFLERPTEIADSQAAQVGERRLVIYPGIDDATVEVVGYDDGVMNVHTLFATDRATSSISASYLAVVVEPDMRATLISTDQTQTLAIDRSGDGSIDRTVQPATAGAAKTTGPEIPVRFLAGVALLATLGGLFWLRRQRARGGRGG